jgi:hypothetical protein
MSYPTSIFDQLNSAHGAAKEDNMASTNWFERLTGFREGDYESTRSLLAVEGDELVSSVNGKRYGIGTLSQPTLTELRSRVKLPTGQRSTVECLVGDVAALHTAPEFEGALFQVASQFNLLEMTGPTIRPEDGVARYAGDPTQGPACAIAAGAATIYRNYCVPVGGGTGQTHDRQIDMLAGLGAALSSQLAQPVSALWKMRNGYAQCTAAGLAAITDLLANVTDEQREGLRGQLAIGLHSNVEVTGGNADVHQRVSQAFCSALPVAYFTTIPHSAWESFARLVLEAAYEATLLAAVEQASTGGSRTVLLTRLGGGAFGNEPEWIDDALWRALCIVEYAGLDIKLVGLTINPSSQEIANRWNHRPANHFTAESGNPARGKGARDHGKGARSIRQTDTVDNSPSWPNDELLHAFWVEKGKLLAGEYPFSPDEPDRARQKVRVLVGAGVDSFVDLTSPDDPNVMQPYIDLLLEEAEKAGRPRPSYRRFSILDTKTITREGYDEILDYIQSEIDAGKIVYVHCWGGKGRTCTVIGCRLIDGGLDYDAAIAELHRLRAGTKKADHPVPDTLAQHHVLRDRAHSIG